MNNILLKIVIFSIQLNGYKINMNLNKENAPIKRKLSIQIYRY